MGSSSNSVSQLNGKYLTLVVEREHYGVAAIAVREIIRFQKVTPVPQLPAYVKGVINLRGSVIPIIDLRIKFGLNAEFRARTCIVVVQVKLASGTKQQMGLIVDGVEDVLEIKADQIEPMPDLGTSIDIRGIIGVAKIGQKVTTLLDVDRIVDADTWNPA
ncbi:MAG: chemotaxis protein CheW [Opitutus sp.]